MVLTVGTVALVAKLFLRLRRDGAGSPPREARNMVFAEALVVLARTVLLVSPHTLFYELGLCLIPFAGFADFRNDRSITLAVLCYVAVLFAVLGRPYFAVTPLAAVPLVGDKPAQKIILRPLVDPDFDQHTGIRQAAGKIPVDYRSWGNVRSRRSLFAARPLSQKPQD